MSPESSATSWITIIWAAIGGICGAILGVFGIGRQIGQRVERFELGLARSHERLTQHDEKFKTTDQAIKEVVAIFSKDGEPRFITSRVCSDNTEECNDRLKEHFSRLERDILAIHTSQDSNLQTILSEVRGIKKEDSNLQALLKAILDTKQEQ